MNPAAFLDQYIEGASGLPCYKNFKFANTVSKTSSLMHLLGSHMSLLQYIHGRMYRIRTQLEAPRGGGGGGGPAVSGIR